jgi:hypothetical protein
VAAATGDDDDPTEPSQTPCILCSVAAVAAHGVASHAPEVAPLAATVLVVRSPVFSERPTVRTPLRYGTLRGPPPSVLV